jgi:hypothetical protein
VTTVVVAAYRVATKPQIGGHFWAYLQYAHGLQQLGCDVYWLERLPAQPDTTALPLFFRRMERYGLGGKAILYRARSDGQGGDVEFVGATATQAEAIFRRADVLLNFHYAVDAEMLSHFRRTVLIDIDPGLLQYWMSRGQIAVLPHDAYATIGENVGTNGVIPDCGIRWLHTRPVVCLDLWPYTYDGDCRRFTTISTWLGGEYVTEGKRVTFQNDKRDSFLQFAELPARTACELELALYLKGDVDADDRMLLEQHGWHIRHSLDLAATPETYRSYIQTSRGEFSCAKPSYVRFQNAWVSDRTLCYLASGKPAVVQHTGPSSYLPNGEGMFRFSTVEEAADALIAVDSNYERHCRAAREIAATFFDVLSELLNAVAP